MGYDSDTYASFITPRQKLEWIADRLCDIADLLWARTSAFAVGMACDRTRHDLHRVNDILQIPEDLSALFYKYGREAIL